MGIVARSRRSAQLRAAQSLQDLYPAVGPWTAAALWHGLAPEAAPVPTTPIDSELDAIVGQRLAPLMLRYLVQSKAEIPATAMKSLRDSAFVWASMSHAVIASGVKVIERLEGAGFPVAVSKGPGIASVYPNAMDRPYSDIDLLVARRDFAAVLALLSADGWYEQVRNRQPRKYFYRFCREAVNLVRESGESIDVHHHVPPWLWAIDFDPASLVGHAVATSVGQGIELPCLTPSDNLLVSALHIVSDKNQPGRTLIVWRDLAQLAHAVEPAHAARRAAEVGLAVWLRAVLLGLPSAVRPQPLIEALGQHTTAQLQHPRRLEALLERPPEGYRVIRSQLMRLPVLNGVAFIAGMTFPSREFLREGLGSESYRDWWFRPDVRARRITSSQ